jgi:integrase
MYRRSSSSIPAYRVHLGPAYGSRSPERCPVAFSFATAWFKLVPIRRTSPDARHLLFTWLRRRGIDDALVQPYSGHASRTSLEIYSRLARPDAQASYDDVIGQFPV